MSEWIAQSGCNDAGLGKLEIIRRGQWRLVDARIQQIVIELPGIILE